MKEGTKEVQLGEAKIISHIYSGYQNIIIRLKDCDIEISPHWHDGNENERTTVEITPKKGYPLVYPFSKYHMADGKLKDRKRDNRIFFYIYKNKKGRLAWKNRIEGGTSDMQKANKEKSLS